MLRLAIKQSELCWSISLTKLNESLTLYLLENKSLSIRNRNLVILSVGVPTAEITCRKEWFPEEFKTSILQAICEPYFCTL